MSTETTDGTPEGDADKSVRKRVFWWAAGACGFALLLLQLAQLIISKQWNPFDFSQASSGENWVAAGIMVVTSLAGAIATGSAAASGAKVEYHVDNSTTDSHDTTINGDSIGSITSTYKTVYDKRRKTITSPALPLPQEYQELKETITGLPDGVDSRLTEGLEKFLQRSNGGRLISAEEFEMIRVLLDANRATAEVQRLTRAFSDLRDEKLRFEKESAAEISKLGDECANERKSHELTLVDVQNLRADLEDAKVSIQKAVAFAVEFGRARQGAEDFLKHIQEKGLGA